MPVLEDPVRLFLIKNNMHCGLAHRLLDVSSELGEVSKEVLKASDYGQTEARLTAELREELGDLLFSVHALASEANLDSNQLLQEALAKYSARLSVKGHIGSTP
mgnify:CR=1 FL=1